MKLTTTRNSFLLTTSLLFLSGALCLNAVAASETWAGAAGDNNWNTGGNWTGPDTPPAAGDVITFGAQGAGGLTLNNNMTVDTTLQGLYFNATAPSFILTGNEITTTGATIDNSLNFETINLPITSTATHTFSAASGGTLLFGGVLSGTGGGINKTLGGTVILTNNNTYTGATTIGAGALTLDFTGGAPSILPSASALSLGGGTLNIKGSSAAASSQTVAGLTITAGDSVISAAPVSGANLPTLALGAITNTYATGGAVEFIGPAYNNAVTTTSGQASSGLQAATAGITTTSGIANQLLRGDGAGTTFDASFATVGLYDFAGTPSTGSSAIVGASQLTGGSTGDGLYTIENAAAIPSGTFNTIIDALGACTANGGATYNYAGIRFNAPGASLAMAYWFSVGGVLVTPNVGANNVAITATAYGMEPAERNTGLPGSIVIWQNNVLGNLSIASLIDGKVLGGSFVKAGPGTFIATCSYTGQPVYTGQTYVNGGVWETSTNLGLGAVTNGAQINLNGGTVLASASFSLDYAGADIRPIVLGNNGGGLAATAGHTLTNNGVVSGGAGTGPLWIGIPASSANSYNAGLVPGTGAGTANTTATNATGTVVLSGTNTYTGSTIVSSGTLKLGATGSINNSSNIITGAGATFDVTAISGYTLGAGYNLMGSGTVNGSVNTSTGTGIYGGTDGTYGTNTFANNLTLVAGAAAYFDLGTSATGSNDLIVVNGTLTLNGNTIHLKAPSPTAVLDAASYLLFSNANPMAGNTSLSLVWDVPPVNSSKYALAVSGNNVVLQYAAGAGPNIVSLTASPNPAYPNESVLISATVLTNGNPISSITADVSQTAGTGQPGSGATTETLYLSAIPNVYTNSVNVGALVPTNSTTTNIITAVDTSATASYATNTLNMTSGAPAISVSASPNPAGLGQTVFITAAVTGLSYTVNPGTVTVDVSAIAGTSPGTTILPLVLSATPGIYTNFYTVLNTTAYGTQTLTVYATDTASELGSAVLNLTIAGLDVWTGLGADNNWTTGANWLSTLAPNPGDQVTFAGDNQPTTDMNNSYSLGAVTFDPTAGSFNITDPSLSYTLTLTGGMTNNSANVQNVSVPVALGGTQTFSVVTNSILVNNGIADDTADSLIGGVIAAGTNTLTLAGNNTYTGPTTIRTGSTLAIADPGQLGGGAYAGTIANAGTLDYNSSIDQTLSGIISGGGNLIKANTDNLTLSVANTYTGGTKVNNGTLTLGTTTSAGTGLITLNGGTLAVGNFAAFAPAITVAGSATVSASATFQFNGLVSVTNNSTMILALAGAGNTMTLNGGAIAAAAGTTVKVADGTQGFLRFYTCSGSTNATFDLGNSSIIMHTRDATTTRVNLGGLAGGSTAELEGARSAVVTDTYAIGANNSNTVFYGTILNGVYVGTNTTVNILKVGTGTLTLGGQNTYTGFTTISNGVLALINNPTTLQDASIAGSTNIFINASAILDVSGNSNPTLTLNSGQTISGGGTINGSLDAIAGSTITPGSVGATGALTITGGLTESGATNNFQLSTNANPDVINVRGNLDVSSGTQVIVLNEFGGGLIPNGTYPLFNYTGTLTGGTANLTVVASPGQYYLAGTLTNITTVTPNQIAFIVTSWRSATNLVWAGDDVSNNWDYVSTNDWINGAASFGFLPGDSVFFTDSGAPNTNVTLQAAMTPAAVVVSNSMLENYTFTGSGNISGSTGLTKTNSGTLTIQNTNTYTGPTVIGGGTLSIASLTNSGLPSPIGAAGNNPTNLVFFGGTLKYTGPSAATDHGVTLNGSGGIFDVIGGTTLTENGPITGSGVLTLTDTGTLALTNANTYTGGTFLNSGQLVFSMGVAIPATGTLTLNGTAAVTVTPANSLPNVQVNGTNIITGNGNSGTGIATLNDAGTLTLFISGGTVFDLTGTMTGSGNLVLGTSTMTLRFNGSAGDNSAVFNLGTGTGTALVRSVGTTAVALGGLRGGTGTQLQGDNSAGGAAVTYTIGGANTNTEFDGIIKDGTAANVSLVKTGTGTLILTNANTYTGPTTVSNGTLLVSGTLANGAVTVDGGTLGGSGTLGGAVTVQAGGTIQPGAGAGAAGSVLTINNSLTLNSGSATLLAVSHNNHTNDQISYQAIVYGGTLTVTTNAGDGPLVAGDTFQLFKASLSFYSGSFSATNLPALGAGLGWSNSFAANGSITVVASAAAGAPVTISGGAISGGMFVISGTNGVPGAQYRILETTNAALAITNWTPVWTNVFGAGGSFSYTNTPGVNPAGFFLLVSP